ncbi:ATP-dependent Clp protease ATP-binding subunit ClpC, partial [bacterium]|nr:ATP-dependent Clp protease ATP-binding subunit ClpC [bacterium]
HVVYRKNAIKAAVDLSCKYINDRQLPDKAIDIIDQAGAKVKMRHFIKPDIARKIESQIEKLMEKEDRDPQNKVKLERKQERLITKYQKILEAWADNYHKSTFYVTAKDIFQVVSSRTGIPVDSLSKKESEILLNLKNTLSERVSYQDDALESLSNSIIRSKSGFKDENRPIGSFLFLGKTGVGKTYTAKCLSECYFGSQENLITVDMSEYSEKINMSRLIGASPGYVGYEDGGQLTDKIKNKPYSVLLFDEIEKAHPEVVQVLLQVLEEGRLTDSFGRVADFSNCIIIMTGNIGSGVLDKKGSVGFSSTSSDKSEKVIDEAKKILGVEFINRIDDVIIFNDFTLDQTKNLLGSEIKKLIELTQQKHKITISVEDSAVEFLARKAHEQNMGARPIRKVIQQNIENLISREVLKKNKNKIALKLSDFS